MTHYPNPALEAELSYRREQLVSARRPAGTRRATWSLGRRRPH